MISIEKIKQLREETAVSMAECKKALEQSKGDLNKAKEILRKMGEQLANKKQSREAGEGIIEAYIHTNKKIGVLLDIRCETDFVARSKEFQELAHDLVLQIAGMKAEYVKEEDIPKEVLEKEREIYTAQFAKMDKPEEIKKKMVEGKINKFKKEVCLLTQPFIKDPSKTIKDIIHSYIAKLGENIVVKRFVRYEI